MHGSKRGAWGNVPTRQRALCLPNPMMLELSTGTPKTDTRKLKTGFLRILNNSVSDMVTVETADSFSAQITLRYHLNFTGDSPEEWFNVENYVQFLAER